MRIDLEFGVARLPGFVNRRARADNDIFRLISQDKVDLVVDSDDRSCKIGYIPVLGKTPLLALDVILASHGYTVDLFSAPSNTGFLSSLTHFNFVFNQGR